MHKTGNLLLSIGVAIATAKLIQVFSKVEVEDLLRPLGLSRRQRRWPGNFAFLTAGLLGGATSALLFTEVTDEETRARVAKKAGALGQAALKRAREVGEELKENVLAG
jgi:hypothetical protein